MADIQRSLSTAPIFALLPAPHLFLEFWKLQLPIPLLPIDVRTLVIRNTEEHHLRQLSKTTKERNTIPIPQVMVPLVKKKKGAKGVTSAKHCEQPGSARIQPIVCTA